MSVPAELIAASPVTRVLDIVGDRWTLLILRDAFQGVRRFDEFRALSGVARSTLASRLAALVAHGLFDRVRYSNAPRRYEYRLTERGRDLHAVTLVAWRWEHRWAPSGARIPRALHHRVCGRSMQPEVRCAGCRRVVTIGDTYYKVSPGRGGARAGRGEARRLSRVTAASHRGSNPAFVHVADIIGDRWTPLVLSTAFLGMKRFDAIRQALDIAPNILTQRLNALTRHRILERRLYSARPPRHEYRLTRKGRDLYPHALLLMQWGDRWLAGPAGPAIRVYHRPCRARLRLAVTCSACRGALALEDVQREERVPHPRGRSQ